MFSPKLDRPEFIMKYDPNFGKIINLRTEYFDQMNIDGCNNGLKFIQNVKI